ncbi:MFS transporter [Streptomyces sp. NPDC015661]|uniref:MFS transporter n=1 Tax=Streptomyces sp. NPDC015661 TaxID=3364961 RepID=UPI0036FD673B
MTGWSGCTEPCTSHCQESAKRPGALTRPPHFGQLGSPLIGLNGPSSSAPRQGRPHTITRPARSVHPGPTGFVSSRIGGRRTLLAGLAPVVVFAALAGTSDTVGQLVGFRAGWGLGNALFVSTSLAVIVGAAAGGSAAAILLYESALGLGMACGPLLGAALGNASWRYPFFGTAALTAIGSLCITAFLREQPRPVRKVSLLDPIRALGHGGLASAAAAAFFYNHAFFTVLAFTPFVPNMTPYRSGAVFFAWGVLLAVFSVLVAPRLQRRFGSLTVLGGSLVLLAADVVVLGYGSHTTAIVCTVLSGAFIGVNNTVFTELALGVSDAPRPVASAGYNFVRWFAAAAAPYLAPKIEEWSDVHTPFVVAGAAAVIGAVIVRVRRTALTHEARVLAPKHATEDGVGAFANQGLS